MVRWTPAQVCASNPAAPECQWDDGQDGQPLGNSVLGAKLSPERMLARFAAMAAPDAGASHEVWLAALDD